MNNEISRHGWKQQEAIELCKAIEKLAPTYGLHIALTGGCLYNEGIRKDVDIVIYRIRQEPEPRVTAFFDALGDLGLEKLTIQDSTYGEGWCTKFKDKHSNHIDILFPEHANSTKQVSK